MTDDDNDLEQLRPTKIDLTVLANLERIAQRLKDTTAAPLIELTTFRGDPTRQTAQHAARAFRFAATVSEQPLRSAAIDAAEQLDRLP